MPAEVPVREKKSDSGLSSQSIVRSAATGVFVSGMILAHVATAQDHRVFVQPGKTVRACGRVVATTCSPESVSFVLDFGGTDILLIDTDAIADRAAVRKFVARILLHRACVTGRLLNRGEPFKVPRLGVDALTSIDLVDEQASNDPFGPGVYRTCDPGVTMPTVIREQRPTFPESALRAGLQGAVWVQALVGVDGRVTKARVLRSVDRELGLDEEAVSTATRWRFKPALKDGQPAPVVVTFELTFTIGSERPR